MKIGMLKKSIFLITIITSFIYIIYRVFFSIPNDNFLNSLVGIIVLLIEIVDFIMI